MIYTASRLVLGAVFLYACWEKILDPAGFAKVIQNYQILPSHLVGPMALVLPWMELVCGISLIVHRWTKGAALVVTALMLVFMTALGINMVRGVDISCGCFTLTEEATPSMWRYMLRDIVLLAMSVWVLLYNWPGSPARQRASQTTAVS